MPVRIYTTNAGTDLSDAEAALLSDLVARHGRAVLLAPTFAELDLCRHDAAASGASLGVDYKTPSSWLRSLWELLGDGRGFVDNLQRQMLFSDMVARLDDATCSRFRAARARCVCSRVCPAMCCRVWRGRRPSDAVATIASLSQKAMPRLVCSCFCAPTRPVWTVEKWSSPARQLALWPAPWPITCRRAPAPYACAVSRRLRMACSSCCLPWRTMGRGRRAACPRAGGDARGACCRP